MMQRSATGFARFLMMSVVSGLLASSGYASPFKTQEEKLSPQELLGKRLFEDTNLSEPAGQACASCHTPGKAFQGNNNSPIPALALGSRAEHFGSRNVPTLTYTYFTPAFHFAKETDEEGQVEYKATGGQFLDGRASDLVAQVEGPLLNENEMNNPSKQRVVEKVQAAAYAGLVKEVYGNEAFADTEMAFANIAAAIAAFEHTAAFAPFSSKFDDVLRGKAQFTAQEARGFEVFKDPEKGNCLACHVGVEDSKNPTDWLFTDYTYDNLGVPRHQAIPENTDPDHYDLGLCTQPGIEAKLPKAVEKESLCGAFKVPTLRNVAVTGPYMHNGYFDKLRDVVEFYATRDTDPGHWYPKKKNGSVQAFDDLPDTYRRNVNREEVPYDRKAGEKPRLSDEDIDALVAFLNSLTDKEKQKP